MKLGEAVLIHSIRGQSRCVCIIAAYLIKKFRWTLFKTLEFLSSRRPDIDLKQGFITQLANLENRLKSLGKYTSKWLELAEEHDSDEILMRNTYLNSQINQYVDYTYTDNCIKDNKIKWNDENSNKLVTVVGYSSSHNNN